MGGGIGPYSSRKVGKYAETISWEEEKDGVIRIRNKTIYFNSSKEEVERRREEWEKYKRRYGSKYRNLSLGRR